MHVIHRNALVPYTTRQMFELVNAVEEYQRFLPWCSASQVHSRTDTEVEGTLEASWSGVKKQFTTKNFLHPFERIEITLVDGPFKHLEGRWQFIQLSETACKVTLDLEFEFAGGIIDSLFQPIFNRIANSLVEAFCARAREIYGEH